MHTGIQAGVESFALSSDLARAFIVFCAAYLVFVMVAAWCGLALAHVRAISVAVVVRVCVSLALAFILAKIFGHIVSDPRPYLVTHTAPLATVSADNGFPSDHVLFAAALTYTLWWIDRRWITVFAIGTVLVALGRLGIGAHHLEDVVGSAVFALVAVVVVARIPLPATWDRPVLALVGLGAPASPAPKATRGAPRGR